MRINSSFELRQQLKSNIVFPNLSVARYTKIMNDLKTKFALTEKRAPHGARHAFEIQTPAGRINFIHYNNEKLMIQSSPGNAVYESIATDISKYASLIPHEKTTDPKDDELPGEYHVGCDEAGAGESFGSMFLGCAVIPKQNLDAVRDILKDKDIKLLTQAEINQTLATVYGFFEGDIKVISASEIDEGSKNALLDRGYVDLIDSAIYNRSKISIVIDDYGIQNELKKQLENIRSKDGNMVVVKIRADKQYAACKIASLIARKARMTEINEINKANTFVDDQTGETVFPGSGNASNPMTDRYLREYRKRYPDAEFPSFVRKKWANVLKVDKDV